MPKVTEEMVRNELQDIICSELNGEKYYSFGAVLYVIQRLITRWEAEHFQRGNDIMGQVREKFPKLEAFDDDELLRLVLFICGPRPMEVQQGPPDLDWVPDDVLFVIPYTNQKAGVPNLQSAKVIRGWDSDVFDAIRWYICLGVITPPAEQPEPPKCPKCGTSGHLAGPWHNTSYKVSWWYFSCHECGWRSQTFQTEAEALAAARKAGE